MQPALGGGMPPPDLMAAAASMAPSPPTLSPADAALLNSMALANHMMSLQQQAAANPNVSVSSTPILHIIIHTFHINQTDLVIQFNFLNIFNRFYLRKCCRTT